MLDSRNRLYSQGVPGQLGRIFGLRASPPRRVAPLPVRLPAALDAARALSVTLARHSPTADVSASPASVLDLDAGVGVAVEVDPSCPCAPCLVTRWDDRTSWEADPLMLDAVPVEALPEAPGVLRRYLIGTCEPWTEDGGEVALWAPTHCRSMSAAPPASTGTLRSPVSGVSLPPWSRSSTRMLRGGGASTSTASKWTSDPVSTSVSTFPAWTDVDADPRSPNVRRSQHNQGQPWTPVKQMPSTP